MASLNARDNDYWLKRLLKDGHRELLAQIEAGQITVYKAAQLASYRKKGQTSPAGKLDYHWRRADHEERKRFILANLMDVNRVVLEVRDDLVKLKAQKASE